MGLISCEQQDDIKKVTTLETAKTAFKRSEPAEFTFKSDAPPSQIKWSVSPEKNVTLTTDGYTARVLFKNPGRYQVTATDNRTTSRTFVNVDTLSYSPGDTVTIPTQPEPPVVNPIDTAKVVVIDTVGTHDRIVSLTGDEFTVSPTLVDSTMGNGVEFSFKSTNQYNCLNSRLKYTTQPGYLTDGNLEVQFLHVIQPGSRYCKEGQSHLSHSLLLMIRNNETKRIKIELNGISYQGSITRSENTYSINWPYTSGIKFLTLNIQR
ncbi:hypothetical protein DSL64_27900 [Dyadobacter luteus]|uniref:Uncharacterized protein n=2 Tax=Dyadobacter luteus TaxID=2259619 RepID=A0A3D8Y2L5_9BACT|nr:hypothetical protein DSL64_27900 [Dyadobacter luteus]